MLQVVRLALFESQNIGTKFQCTNAPIPNSLNLARMDLLHGSRVNQGEREPRGPVRPQREPRGPVRPQREPRGPVRPQREPRL